MGKESYVGVSTEDVEHVLVKGGREALEDVLVDVVGLTTDLAHGSIKSGKSAALLKLDNVLVSDESAAGLEERSGLGALLDNLNGGISDGVSDGSAESQGKNSKKDGQTHLGRKKLLKDEKSENIKRRRSFELKRVDCLAADAVGDGEERFRLKRRHRELFILE